MSILCTCMAPLLTASVVAKRDNYRIYTGPNVHAHAHGPPSPRDWEAPAKQGRTTGRELASGVAAVPIVPGAGPARESATILPSGTNSPPDHLGLVPRARRTTLRRTCSNSLQQEVADARGAAMSLTSLLTEKG